MWSPVLQLRAATCLYRPSIALVIPSDRPTVVASNRSVTHQSGSGSSPLGPTAVSQTVGSETPERQSRHLVEIPVARLPQDREVPCDEGVVSDRWVTDAFREIIMHPSRKLYLLSVIRDSIL